MHSCIILFIPFSIICSLVGTVRIPPPCSSRSYGTSPASADMDHHCPYINNCVGRGNHRPFLLFLFWVSVTGIYGVYCLLRYLCFHWATLTRSQRVLSHALKKYWIPYVAMYYAARATPTHLLAVMYLAVICGTLGLTVGGLLLA